MSNEKLRGTYLAFITQLRDDKTFNEGLYDSIFDTLTVEAARWRLTGSVPMRAFEVCIDLLYGLSNDENTLSEPVRERTIDAKNEIYGLLMGLD